MMEQLLKPIQPELEHFEAYLEKFLASVPNEKIRDNYRVFFNQPGKRIRPALLFLSYGAVGGEIKGDGLYDLALILELLHSASLVHDDIVDDDLTRRGHETIHQVFGNKIAVLAGDTLFSYAFMKATTLFDKAYNEAITTLAYKMCMAELAQANGISHKAAYLEMIQGKTAEFMRVACYMGARYGGADPDVVTKLSQFGDDLGMTYQLIDDANDQDPNGLKFFEPGDELTYYQRAKEALKGVPSSPYKTQLLALLEFVITMK